MIIEAILKINPNAKFSIIDNDINRITWLDGTTPISKADIQVQFTAVEFDMAMEDLRDKRDRLLKRDRSSCFIRSNFIYRDDKLQTITKRFNRWINYKSSSRCCHMAN